MRAHTHLWMVHYLRFGAVFDEVSKELNCFLVMQHAVNFDEVEAGTLVYDGIVDFL